MTTDRPPEWTPPSSPLQFNDGVPDIRIGELYGLRSFEINTDGWLTGVLFNQPWMPGVNKAECWRATAWEADGITSARTPGRVTIIDAGGDDTPVKRTGWVLYPEDGGDPWETLSRPTPVYGARNDPNHRLGTCVCGLHGFLEGSLDYGAGTKRISGVVRAWGQMALGDRGFRAQFARIVALYVPRELGIDSGGGFSFKRARYGVMGVEAMTLPPSDEVVKRVIDRYNVPTYRTLDELLAAFPTTPPPSKEAA